MSFIKVKKNPARTSRVPDEGLYIKNEKSGRVIIYLGKKVSAILGLNTGASIGLYLGKEDDAGRMEIRAESGGDFIATLKDVRFQINVSKSSVISVFGGVPKDQASTDLKIGQNKRAINFPVSLGAYSDTGGD